MRVCARSLTSAPYARPVRSPRGRLQGVACDYTDPTAPVLYADVTVACWRGTHAVQGALAMIAFAYYVPLSIMIGARMLDVELLRDVVRLDASAMLLWG
jgi:hypothetical protein